MLNEEISKEALDDASRIAEEKIVQPVTQFMVEHLVKPTAKMLVNDLKAVAATRGKMLQNRLHSEHGEMSVKDLIRKDQGAQAMDIDGMGLGDFRRIANRYGVDFAIVKSADLDPPKYSVFFKARDADAINAVVSEYTARQMKISKRTRPSILAKL